jgi:multidrug resistance efflux pump
VAYDPNGGGVIKELRIRDGQKVKRGEIIAVMSNYPVSEVALRINENNLRKIENIREKVLKGTSATDIKLQEDALNSAIESERLSAILRERSGRPAQERELEVALSEQRLKQQRESLELAKRSLEIQLAQNEIDIRRYKALVEDAQRALEQSLVRSPVDGIVIQVNSRQGELVTDAGIAKIVDMRELRVFATVDELHLPRLKKGAPVEVTFRGSPQVYKAHIALAPISVKREKRSEADKGVANVRQVEVEIQADDGVTFPEIIGREARVIFL